MFFLIDFFPSFLGYIISSNLGKSSTQISQRDKQHKFATTSLVSSAERRPEIPGVPLLFGGHNVPSRHTVGQDRPKCKETRSYSECHQFLVLM